MGWTSVFSAGVTGAGYLLDFVMRADVVYWWLVPALVSAIVLVFEFIIIFIRRSS